MAKKEKTKAETRVEEELEADVDKKTKIKIIAVILLIIAFIPIPVASYLDGGTRVYVALTYKIYAWNKGYGGGEFDKTKVYILDDYFKTYDELWEMEWEEFKDSPERVNMFVGTVVEIKEESMVVEPLEDYYIRDTSDRIEFSTKESFKYDVKVGDNVIVKFRGTVEETYPAKINAYLWWPEQHVNHLK